MGDEYPMSQVPNNTFKLKRGQQSAVEQANPLLQAGEPIVIFCNDGKTRFKVGDGYTLYNDLEWTSGDSQREVMTYPNRFDFPNPPAPEYYGSVFKATNEAKLYQWNPAKFIYESLNTVNVEITMSDIEIINGGTAVDLMD